MVRSVTTRETEWDAQQVAWMLALAAYEAGLCGRCGGALEETTKLEHDYNNPFGVAFYAPAPGFPRQCHCCAALDRMEQQAVGQNPQHPAALMHAVRLVPRG